MITARAITVTATTDTKTYDATTSSRAIPTITSGTLAGTDTAAFTQTFDTALAGTDKTLTPAGSVIDGNAGANYAVTFVSVDTGVITGRAITVTAASDTKGYDATTSSDGVPTITSGSLASGDTATFTQMFGNANVGTGKTLTPAARSTTATVAPATRSPSSTTRPVRSPPVPSPSPRRVTPRATTPPTPRRRSRPSPTARLAGTDTASFTQTFGNANVGTAKTLTPAGTVSDGNSGNNYLVTFVNDTTGEITARAITVTATTDTKGYDRPPLGGGALDHLRDARRCGHRARSPRPSTPPTSAPPRRSPRPAR